MKQIAIIAPTASGKTNLSISIAKKTNSIILSLDSLAMYKEIDIASAKPTIQEQDGIIHFGINEFYPNKSFGVIEFIEVYKRAKACCKQNNKNLIIVGGSSFYLKSMIDGISCIPEFSKKTILWVENKLNNIKDAYSFMFKLDEQYMKTLSSNDKYRVKKALLIYKQTGQTPTVYFKNNPPKSIIKDIQLYEIYWSVDDLRQRIKKRTNMMIKNGLIDEVIYLEKKYTREPKSMQSIGIIETLEYLDGKITKDQLIENIIVNTARLAKRQRTFNNGQFKNIIKNDLDSLEAMLF
ncbi:tRNA dimethylallyltransferase [hydrothermal vent metagenome]|uniref:tRNA dimethylallyltransferase n=1 Tax=hydrothermal vent metagenome TaxID=652676 RepID=A0A3B1E2E9_9ZZZZ